MPDAFRIERLDPRLDELIAADAVAEPIARDLEWAEGPVWDRAAGRLLFSDVKANRIYQWRRDAGVSVFREHSGYAGDDHKAAEPGSNGLTFDAGGRLTVCQHGNRRVIRLEADGTETVLADRYQGQRFNSPNDLVYRGDGSLYFTDPAYGLPAQFDDPARELAFCGVFRWSDAGGVQLLTDALPRPNGIAFSPDETSLYVTCGGDPGFRGWHAFPVAGDGTLGPGRLLFDAAAVESFGGPDGLKVDAHGHLFGAGLDRVTITTASGETLGRLFFNALTGNVAWGENGSTLFICAEHTVWRLPTRTRGAGWPDQPRVPLDG